LIFEIQAPKRHEGDHNGIIEKVKTSQSVPNGERKHRTVFLGWVGRFLKRLEPKTKLQVDEASRILNIDCLNHAYSEFRD
jgi:hypothetical protein